MKDAPLYLGPPGAALSMPRFGCGSDGPDCPAGWGRQAEAPWFLLLLFMGLGLGGPATKHDRHSSFVPRPATACWDTMKQVLVRAHLLRSLLHLAFGSFDPYKCLCLQMDDFAAITKVDGN